MQDGKHKAKNRGIKGKAGEQTGEQFDIENVVT